MIISFLIGAAIGAVIGVAIAEICLYIEGQVTAFKVREEVKKQEALNAIQEFLVTQVEQTSVGPKIHIDGTNSSGEVIAHLTIEGGSSTNLTINQTFYK